MKGSTRWHRGVSYFRNVRMLFGCRSPNSFFARKFQFLTAQSVKARNALIYLFIFRVVFLNGSGIFSVGFHHISR